MQHAVGHQAESCLERVISFACKHAALVLWCCWLAGSALMHMLWCRAAGEEPLPEEDPAQFKPIPEPSPLDGMLITNQISNLCSQLHISSAQALEKLYLMEGVQKVQA